MRAGAATVAAAGEHPVRVLVCDDEDRLAELTAGLLRHHGYQAEAVADGGTALSRLQSEAAFDILVLDVNLAGTSAAEVMRSIREGRLPVRVILTSGYAAEDVPPELTVETSYAGYLPKPYPVDRLLHAVQTARPLRPVTGVRVC